MAHGNPGGMTTLYIVLLLAGVVCFALDAFRATISTRVNLTALGLALVFTVPLIQHIRSA